MENNQHAASAGATMSSSSSSFDPYFMAAPDAFDSLPIRPRRESKLGTWKAGRKHSLGSDNQRENDEVRSVESVDDDDNVSWTSVDAAFTLSPFATPHHPHHPHRSIHLATVPVSHGSSSQYAPSFDGVAAASYRPPPMYYPPTATYFGATRGSAVYDMVDPLQVAGSSLFLYYEVEFKRYRRLVFVGHAEYEVGDPVKVEADRGHDVGHVIRLGTSLHDVAGGDDKRVTMPLKRVLRRASPSELHFLACKMEEEAMVLDVCRDKVRQRGLPMQVIDAEFQFDRHKLTFFFQADRRIDFRELVRDLFAIYKTRIWLQQILPDHY
ncbi:Aste57867_22250 [Aphanomyces stellatus]|uniref:Aste57867_22250 protein n=1 Tax=Aphanomyces stellatus TaxID=120398 RepID=A0A485LPL0_9STRA|nr:hypothetical protein As57867_022180 [Aphanomyces stellatus]VFT98917.1 Aste57867_22250 [Aphanomyces stellatus]